MPQNPYIAAPSLICGQQAALIDSGQEALSAGAGWLHLDIMDGHFVPNITFGPQAVAEIRAALGKDVFLDTHLMLSEPHKYIEAFAQAGSDLLSIHIEPDYDIGATLKAIEQVDCLKGLVVNPGTPIEKALPHLHDIDLFLIMSVEPGFGGQAFIEESVGKIEQLAQLREQHGLNFRIQVDGGVNLETGARCKAAGADTFVVGSAFYKASDKPGLLRQLEA